MAVKQKKAPAVAAKSDININEIVELAASTAASAVARQMKPLTKAVLNLQGQFEALELERLAAGKKEEDEEDDEDAACMKSNKKEEEEEDEEAVAASKKKEEEEDDEDDDEDDMESAIDKGDLEEMGPDMEDDAEDDDTPGQLSKGAKNKGAKQVSENKLGKKVAEGVTGSAFMKNMKVLASAIGKINARLDSMEASQKRTSRQLTAASETMSRPRSISAAGLDQLSRGLLAKSGLDASALQDEGKVLTVSEVDAIIANGAPDMSPRDRMQFKNRLLQGNLMEQGAVNRHSR